MYSYMEPVSTTILIGVITLVVSNAFQWARTIRKSSCMIEQETNENKDNKK